MENGAKVGGEQEAGAGLHRALTRSRVDSVLWRWTLTLRRFCSALGLICGGVSMETLRLRHLDYSKSEVGVEPELTPSLQTAHLLIKGKNSAERDCRPGPLISLPFPPEAEAGDQGHSSRGPSPPVGHSPSLWPGDTPCTHAPRAHPRSLLAFPCLPQAAPLLPLLQSGSACLPSIICMSAMCWALFGTQEGVNKQTTLFLAGLL